MTVRVGRDGDSILWTDFAWENDQDDFTAPDGDFADLPVLRFDEAQYRCPKTVWDEQLQAWISDAKVAEVPFTAFTGRRKHEHVTGWLVVRLVERLQPMASDGTV